MGRKIAHFLNVFLILAGVYFLSACSGNLSARVFLDSNANNIPDGKELLLAGMPATLYRDGGAVEKLLTDSKGNVNFAIWQTGKYCVRLDPTEVSQMKLQIPATPEPETSKSSKSLTTKDDPESTPEATPSSSPEPSDSPEASSEASSQPVKTIQAYEACSETKGILNLSLEVPVPLDFAKTIASIPEPAAQEVSAGDEIEIPIIFPRHCSLNGLTLPEAVGVPVGGDLLRVITDWNVVVAAGGKPIVDREPVAVNQDTLREFPLKLKVTDKILDLDPARVEITPQVSCPGGRGFDLKTHVLETGGASMFEIYHDRQGQAVEGGEVTIVTHVINHSEIDFIAGNLQLVFTVPHYGDTTFDDACAGSSHCHFALGPQQQKVLETKIKIPDSLTETTSFELSTQLKARINGYERVFQEEAPAQFGVLP